MASPRKVIPLEDWEVPKDLEHEFEGQSHFQTVMSWLFNHSFWAFVGKTAQAHGIHSPEFAAAMRRYAPKAQCAICGAEYFFGDPRVVVCPAHARIFPSECLRCGKPNNPGERYCSYRCSHQALTERENLRVQFGQELRRRAQELQCLGTKRKARSA